MPIEDAISRVSEITALAKRVADPTSVQAEPGGFTAALDSAPAASRGRIGLPYGATPSFSGRLSVPVLMPYSPGLYGYHGVAQSQSGLRALWSAMGEIGVQEEPPGSNDGARIAQYRSATAGAVGTPGRWCAYFVSWAAAQAGAPLGDYGQGFASVAQINEWAARTGRLVPSGEAARPGDLILFGSDHVGIVESVGPGDRLTTVEGNHSDRVERVERSVGEATGFVRL